MDPDPDSNAIFLELFVIFQAYKLGVRILSSATHNARIENSQFSMPFGLGLQERKKTKKNKKNSRLEYSNPSETSKRALFYQVP